MKVYHKARTSLPQKAGIAILEYDDQVTVPERDGSTITLPRKGWSLYQLTPSWDQFLVVEDKEDSAVHDRFDKTEYHQAWFGGTDENPFLVQLEVDDWTRIWERDEVFNTLIPKGIKRYEKHFGKGKTKRQGDMFCYPAPLKEYDRDKGHSLFGTRHLLTGKDVLAESIYSNVDGDQGYFCQGIIQAPDHTDLVLEEIHYVAQTAKLHTPKLAD